MTVIDHPARRVAELNQRIAGEFTGRPCWRASLEWDALLALDFGAKRELIGRRGPVTIGEVRVLLDDVDWFVERDGRVVLTAAQAEDDAGSCLDSLVTERELRRIEPGVYWSLVFSGGVVIRCRRPLGEPNCTVVELRLGNGDYVDCFADGRIETESTAL